jgi:hypothetical protein
MEETEEEEDLRRGRGKGCSLGMTPFARSQRTPNEGPVFSSQLALGSHGTHVLRLGLRFCSGKHLFSDTQRDFPMFLTK